MRESGRARTVTLPRVVLLVGVVAVFALALWARLAAVARTGGLMTMGRAYDDGVYFAAAEALAFGRMPYRDFVLLHPPGVVVAALPFGWLARLTTDTTGMAAARIAWTVVGAANAALVSVTARRYGPVAALAAGAFYAVWPPVVRFETSVFLEALGTLAVLSCLALLSVRSVGVRPRVQVAAGLALGFAPSVKIWGVVPVAVVLGWVLLTFGLPVLGRVTAGAVVGAAAVCLPFFAAAPRAMWRMVVTDQLGRGSVSQGALDRLRGTAGLGTGGAAPAGTLRVGAAAGVVVLCLLAVAIVLACTSTEGALYVALTVAALAVLLLSPSFFAHYATFPAPFAALALAAALGRTARWRPVQPTLVALAAVATAGLWTVGTSVPDIAPFPAAALRPAVAGARCVTADSPAALVALDVLGPGLRRGCAVAIDVSGTTYDTAALPLQPDGTAVRRSRNPLWQAYLMRYLRTGDATILVRGRADGLSAANGRTYRSWPTLVARGGYRIRASGRVPPDAGVLLSRRTSASISS